MTNGQAVLLANNLLPKTWNKNNIAGWWFASNFPGYNIFYVKFYFLLFDLPISETLNANVSIKY